MSGVARADFAVTGVGLCRPAVEGPVDPRPFLKSPKTRKFMGLQDELAVVAAGRALADAGLGGVDLGPRAGVFFVVGHIPFEQADVDALLDASLGADGALDMQRFSTAGMDAVSPLLTFRCLPNMPAYHVSANFDVQGPYFVGYPGVEQSYTALSEALAALSEGEIDVALVGGVAHQRNFLVEAHFARLTPPTGPEALFDAAAVLVIERTERATARGARMRALGVSMACEYAPVSPFATGAASDSTARDAAAEHAAALPLAVAEALVTAPGAAFEHRCRTADGFVGASRWGRLNDTPMGAPNRVVITGLGCVTPIGLDVASFGAALFAGVSGAGPITLFDPARLRTRVAAEVKLATADLPYRDRKLAFAERAAAEAMADAGLPAGGADAALSLGIGLELFSLDDMRARRDPGFVLPTAPAARMTTLQTPSDLCAAHLSARYDLRGAPALHLSACAAGTDALGAAFRRIRRGDARLVLAGGADSMINPLGVGGFSKIQAMTVQNERPAAASRPFDEARDGFLLGEGAGMLVLESLESARARGARIHAEIRGYGRSLDAHGISEPHPEGRGALAAMRNALADAGLRPEDVDAVNAHGTATPKNDRIEAAAVRALLGDRWPTVPVNATKSMIGHLIAAAGPVESIGVVLGLQRGALHPTLNLDALDPACALDHVTGTARTWAHRTVLKSSFGFGGHNASLVFTRFEETPPMTRPTREAALERIRAALSDRLAVPLADITAESLLIDELGADSLDFVDLMFVFEKEFGVKILEDELASLAKMEGAIPPEVVEKVRGWVPDLVIHPDTPLTAATLFRRLTVESLWRMISERLPAPTA